MTTSDSSGILLPGDSYPDWLTFNIEGSSMTFEIPQVNERNLKKMMCHVHYSSPESITSDGLKNLLVINHTKAIIKLYKRNALASFEDEEWQRVLSKIEPGNKVQIVVVFWSRLTVNKTTTYLIYEPMDEKIEHYLAPNKNVIVSSGDENVGAVKLIFPQVESMDDLQCVCVKSLIKRLLKKCLSCKYCCLAKSEKKKSQVRLKDGERMLVKIDSYEGCEPCIGSIVCGGLTRDSFGLWMICFTCRLVTTINAMVAKEWDAWEGPLVLGS